MISVSFLDDFDSKNYGMYIVMEIDEKTVNIL